MAFQQYRKDPAATLDWTVSWADYLEDGDTIVTSTWDADDGLTVESTSNTTTTTTVWLSGGEHGVNYNVVNQIVTDAGRTDERTITIRVVNR